jgi:hypothetical protein
VIYSFCIYVKNYYQLTAFDRRMSILYRVYPTSTDKLSGQILRSKISITLLIHMGSKTLSLRDNQQKRKNKLRSEFLGFYGVICALNRGAKFWQFL